MDSITIRAAKTNLSQRLARVEAGEDIILARGKQPVAKLVPFTPAVNQRRFGALRGRLTVDASFADPLPEPELAAWQ